MKAYMVNNKQFCFVKKYNRIEKSYLESKDIIFFIFN